MGFENRVVVDDGAFCAIFLLVMVRVAASAERRSAEPELSGRTSPFFQNFTSRTQN